MPKATSVEAITTKSGDPTPERGRRPFHQAAQGRYRGAGTVQLLLHPPQVHGDRLVAGGDIGRSTRAWGTTTRDS
jgi:hypothetical protein